MPAHKYYKPQVYAVKKDNKPIYVESLPLCQTFRRKLKMSLVIFWIVLSECVSVLWLFSVFTDVICLKTYSDSIFSYLIVKFEGKNNFN